MAKKKVAGGVEVGSSARVKPDVVSPEFNDIAIGGWTGRIVEVTGKSPAQKVILEWDQPTIDQMPADYVSRCEAQQLAHWMACLDLEQVDIG